jgi:hypothetical protein
LITLFLTLVFTRSAVEAMFLRAPGSLFMQTADGQIENIYTLKLVNKTMRDLPVELRLEGVAGQLEVMGEKSLVVPAGKLKETSVLIKLDPDHPHRRHDQTEGRRLRRREADANREDSISSAPENDFMSKPTRNLWPTSIVVFFVLAITSILTFIACGPCANATTSSRRITTTAKSVTKPSSTR